jgi:chloramphenicol 3-O-phosphotransferase
VETRAGHGHSANLRFGRDIGSSLTEGGIEEIRGRRDGDRRSAEARILPPPSSLLYDLSGASGSGKSSLLSAAALPELHTAEWIVLEARLFSDPVERVRVTLLGSKEAFKHTLDALFR